MSRPYSKTFIEELHECDPDITGTALALACVRANLPANYVAKALEVSRMTIFSWFRGKPLRHKNLLKVRAFTNLVENDLSMGMLPVKTVKQAKEYLQEMVGRTF
jgi:hypothetical protein